MTRIGINLAWMVPGVVGGSEDAWVAALRAVRAPATAAGLEPVLFALPSFREAHPEVADSYEVHELGVNGRSKVRRVLAENVELDGRMRRAGIVMAHHAGGVVPPRSGLPSVLTVQDTQPLDLPANFSLVKRAYLGLLLGRSARSARAVTVPSEFVRRQLVHHAGVAEDKVTVVPWSVPAARDAPTAAQVEAVLTRHGITPPYVLYPAITYPHKDHATLLEAVASSTTGVQLVLTGGAAACEEAVVERAGRGDLRGRVHRLGRVPRAELAALMAGAAAVAVPSRYEGFGLPALEAMAAGRPVVVSDAGSLPEVVGHAGLVVPAGDVAAWAVALDELVTDRALAARLVADGLRAAASWTPERTASGLVDVWTRTVADLPRTRS